MHKILIPAGEIINIPATLKRNGQIYRLLIQKNSNVVTGAPVPGYLGRYVNNRETLTGVEAFTIQELGLKLKEKLKSL